MTKAFNLWLSCHTQQEIAEVVDYARETIKVKIYDFGKNAQLSDFTIFDNFKPEVYETWSFGKSTNETKYFGNIPPEIIDNLLYYYTKPFDIVFDPFGGHKKARPMMTGLCASANRSYPLALEVMSPPSSVRAPVWWGYHDMTFK